jgi:hypothetical protein
LKKTVIVISASLFLVVTLIMIAARIVVFKNDYGNTTKVFYPKRGIIRKYPSLAVSTYKISARSLNIIYTFTYPVRSIERLFNFKLAEDGEYNIQEIESQVQKYCTENGIVYGDIAHYSWYSSGTGMTRSIETADGKVVNVGLTSH